MWKNTEEPDVPQADDEMYAGSLTQVYRHPLVIFNAQCFIIVGRGSSVSIATRYELDGPGIESRRLRDFPPPPPQTDSGAHPASYTLGFGFFPGSKAFGAWR